MSDDALTPTLVPDAEARPWFRLPSESPKHYHAFVHYRDLPAWQRSIRRAYAQHVEVCRGFPPTPHLRQASPSWKALHIQQQWVARARAYDAHVAAVVEAERIDAIRAMHQRHIALSLSLQNRVVERLQALAAANAMPMMSMRDMAVVLTHATKIERLARGEPSEIVAASHTVEPLLDLSPLSDAELETFQSLLSKATSSLPSP